MNEANVTRNGSGTCLRHSAKIIMFIFFSNGFLFGNWAPIIPIFKNDLDLDELLLSTIFLSMAVGGLIAMAMAGKLIERWGARPTCYLSSLLYMLFLPCVIAAPNYPMALIGMICFGLANGVMDVAMNTQASLYEARTKSYVMSICHAMFSFGFMSGAFLGGEITSRQFFSPTVQILAVSSFLFIIIVPSYKLLLPRNETNSTNAKKNRRFSSILENKGVLFLSITGLLCLLMEGSIADWSVLYYRQEIGVDQGRASRVFFVFSAAMFLTRLAGDAVARRYSNRFLLASGALLTASGLVLGLYPTTLVVGYIGFFLAGIGLANLVPAVFRAAGKIDPNNSGLYISQVAAVSYLGFLAGPLLIGYLADQTTLRLALSVLIVAATGAALCSQLAIEALHSAQDRDTDAAPQEGDSA
jgi:predicted MFS family arabinose efflux permease